MSFKFQAISRGFLNAYRNGPTFSISPGSTTDRLQGNAGDLAQLKETIRVSVVFNEDETITAIYDGSGTNAIITAPGVDFIAQGLFLSANIDVFSGGEMGASSVINILGLTNEQIEIDKTALDFIADGPHTDIVIRVKNVPTYSTYKYGVIDSNH